MSSASNISKRRYRDPLVITAQVLSASKSGARKTAIMYQANLSFEQLRRYLTRLIELGLLMYDKENRLYNVTSKGLSYLKNFTELQGITEALGTKRATLITLLCHDEKNPQDASAFHSRDVNGFLASQLGRGTFRWSL